MIKRGIQRNPCPLNLGKMESVQLKSLWNDRVGILFFQKLFNKDFWMMITGPNFLFFISTSQNLERDIIIAVSVNSHMKTISNMLKQISTRRLTIKMIFPNLSMIFTLNTTSSSDRIQNKILENFILILNKKMKRLLTLQPLKNA